MSKKSNRKYGRILFKSDMVAEKPMRLQQEEIGLDLSKTW